MFRDFKELLSAFNAQRVRYLIVGGYAVSFHAQPRAAKHLDILISADAENSKAVYAIGAVRSLAGRAERTRLHGSGQLFPNGHAAGDGGYLPEHKRC